MGRSVLSIKIRDKDDDPSVIGVGSGEEFVKVHVCEQLGRSVEAWWILASSTIRFFHRTRVVERYL